MYKRRLMGIALSPRYYLIKTALVLDRYHASCSTSNINNPESIVAGSFFLYEQRPMGIASPPCSFMETVIVNAGWKKTVYLVDDVMVIFSLDKIICLPSQGQLGFGCCRYMCGSRRLWDRGRNVFGQQCWMMGYHDDGIP